MIKSCLLSTFLFSTANCFRRRKSYSPFLCTTCR